MQLNQWDNTRLTFIGHDYKPTMRDARESTLLLMCLNNKCHTVYNLEEIADDSFTVTTPLGEHEDVTHVLVCKQYTLLAIGEVNGTTKASSSHGSFILVPSTAVTLDIYNGTVTGISIGIRKGWC